MVCGDVVKDQDLIKGLNSKKLPYTFHYYETQNKQILSESFDDSIRYRREDEDEEIKKTLGGRRKPKPKRPVVACYSGVAFEGGELIADKAGYPETILPVTVIDTTSPYDEKKRDVEKWSLAERQALKEIDVLNVVQSEYVIRSGICYGERWLTLLLVTADQHRQHRYYQSNLHTSPWSSADVMSISQASRCPHRSALIPSSTSPTSRTTCPSRQISALCVPLR